MLTAAERQPESAVLAALVRLEWLLYAQPHDMTQATEATLPGLIEELSRSGNERGLAKAHLAAAEMHWLPLRTTAAAEHALVAAKHAGEAGDERLRAEALTMYVAALTYGPKHVEVVKEELDAIEDERPGPLLAARLLLARGQLMRLAGNVDQARELNQQALENYLALGTPLLAAVIHYHVAELELTNGHPDIALMLLQQADATLAVAGERSFRSIIQG